MFAPKTRIGLGTKIYLLLWKDLKILSSNKLALLLQIVTPLIFCVILLVLRTTIFPLDIPTATDYIPLPVPYSNYSALVAHQLKSAPAKYNDFNETTQMSLAYTPRTNFTKNIMRYVLNKMQLTEIIPFATSKQMVSYMENETICTPLAGVAFTTDNRHPPVQVKVSLMFPAELRNPSPDTSIPNWVTDLLYPLFEHAGPRNLFIPDGGSPPGYYREHFVSLQHSISTAIILGRSNLTEEDLPAVFLQRFTDPKMRVDKIHALLKLMLPLIFFLTFLYPVFSNVKIITMEKEMQLKEAMKIMGLSSWLHWLAWMVNIMCFNIITVSGILLLLMTNWSNDISVFTFSDPLAVGVFLIIFTFSMATYCFLFSVIFDKANTAATVAGFVWFLYLVPYFLTEPTYEQMSYVEKVVICFFQNTALSFGFQLILHWEGHTEGLQFGNLFKPVSVDDTLTVGVICAQMMFSAFVHMSLALYIEKVRPGEFGVPRAWYFPVEPIVNLCRSRDNENTESTQNWRFVEYIMETKPAGIEIRKLRKVFDKNRVAVQGLSLKMYPDEITVFLGENGAGKTTTMSMLTGMMLPSAGTAVINGCDISTDIDCVRHSIGFCPQHNILFDELTVRDHIYFYCTLKGLTAEETAQEIEKYVTVLELVNKVDAKAKTLPGGMKRRLSVVVAFCGGSRVVLCDEPTSGMDPSARRAMWDLLQLEKKGRTIMLSTQFMDEADVLGDRVAIMKAGELICYGSAMYLKNIFASGYLLSIEKGLDCDVDQITRLISTYIPSIIVDRNVGTELTYRLRAADVNSFEYLLASLEARAYELKIQGYGISQTNMEDVFMQIIKEQPQEVEKNYEEMSKVAVPEGELKQNEGLARFGSQLHAMFYKRCFVLVNNWHLWLVQNIIPIALISITVYIVRRIKVVRVLPPLPIALDMYGNNPIALLMTSREITNPVIRGVERAYRDEFEHNVAVPRVMRQVENIARFIKNMNTPEYVTFGRRTISGLELRNNSVVVWFNNLAYHSVPVALDLYHDALLNSYCARCRVQFINAPLRFTVASRLSMHNSLRDFGFQLAANLGFAMSFVSAFYVIFYIKERTSRAKLLQMVSGASLWTYWLTSWVIDFLLFLFTTGLLTSTMFVLKEEGWDTPEDMARMFVLFVTFIWAILPFIYLSSMVVDVPSAGLILSVMFGVFMGNAIFYIVYAFEFPSTGMMETGKLITWVMMAVPQFAVMHGLKNLDRMNTFIPICKEACLITSRCEKPEDMCRSNVSFAKDCCVLNYYAWQSPGIGRNMVFQMVVGLVLFVLMFLIEFDVPQSIYYNSLLYERWIGRKPEIRQKMPNEYDYDVYEENLRIERMGTNQIGLFNLVLRGMTKYYGQFLAVNNLSLAVGQQECFGLLGVNGAGKTTTFKMLIGDVKIDGGEAWVRGSSLSTQMRQVYKNIGYCPQFDALFDELTTEETLKVYCLLRGIPSAWIEYVTMQLATSLNFVQHLRKRSGELSGGNRRKVSTAIALIGSPAVVYLDEPTTGMDPGAKRRLWEVLTRYRMNGKTIVLTSHSMEECEALCTRLAIMVNGEFQCIGSTQHLKGKFAKNFLLLVLMQADVRYGLTRDAINVQMMVREFVEYTFDGMLKENYQGRLTFHIPMTMSWSRMFGVMERNRARLRIENYSLSQGTLEEVFLSFTKYQKDH